MSVFTKPYPRRSSPERKLLFAFAFGIFVFLFLAVFQPFGLNDWQTPYKILKLAGYGGVTAFVILFNGFVIERVFRNWFLEKNWTVGREIISAIWNIVFIGSLNLLYTHYLGVARLNWWSFLAFQWITLIVGAIPVTIVTILNHSRLLRINTKGALELNAIIDSEPAQVNKNLHAELILVAENGKDSLVFKPEQILAISAADNYIEIYSIQTAVKKELLRSTLKNVENATHEYPQLMRCHRSFIVNLNHVEKVSGNSQGLKLHLHQLDFQVPVSRSLNEIIRKKLQDIHSIRPK